MEAAISLPEDLYAAADALARRRGVSRDELFASALAEYVARHGAATNMAYLDRIYSAEPGGPDPVFRRVHAHAFGAERR